MRRAIPFLCLAACSEQGLASLGTFDSWVQPDVNVKADVLFVIDDSSSMAEEQERLAENFQRFMEVLAETAADYQLGVVTTDVSAEDAGVLRGGILTPDTPALEQAFRDAVIAGTGGSRDEEGLAAAVLATRPETNPGFVREDSKLNAVFISDEDDHSQGAVESYVERLAGVAGEEGFAAHALVGDLPMGCASGTSAADAGTRYLEATEMSAGLAESICAEDYSSLLTRVGLDVTGISDTFYLTRLPSPDTLEVLVEDVRIPEREDDGWTYDVGENAIVFHGRAVPRPGMGIEVKYTPWMGEEPETE
ncbi:MAG: vWA domain-containing protein [Myxococcota bacterium]